MTTIYNLKKWKQQKNISSKQASFYKKKLNSNLNYFETIILVY